MESTDEPVELVERVAALDVGKAAVMACVRVPHEDRPGRRRQEIREYATLSRSLLELADWLRCERIELVAMEATSDYWKPVYYLLEAEGFTCWLLNAKHVKNVPGRPKTDKIDSAWLAKVVERGMCSPSLVHSKPIRQLRDLTGASRARNGPWPAITRAFRCTWLRLAPTITTRRCWNRLTSSGMGCLQRTLLPPALPAIPGLQVAAYYHPASPDEIGGDFYDLFPMTENRWERLRSRESRNVWTGCRRRSNWRPRG